MCFRYYSIICFQQSLCTFYGLPHRWSTQSSRWEQREARSVSTTLTDVPWKDAIPMSDPLQQTPVSGTSVWLAQAKLAAKMHRTVLKTTQKKQNFDTTSRYHEPVPQAGTTSLPSHTISRTAATDVAEEAILAAHPLLAGCAMWHWCGTPNFTVARTTATDVAEETVLAGHPLLASGACSANTLQVNRGRLFHSVVIRLLGLLLQLHCWRTPNFTVARTAATDVAEEAILAAHPLLAGCAMWPWCGTPNFTVARTTATDVAEETILAGHPLLASGACSANTLQVNRGRLFHSVVVRLLGLLLELHCWRTPNFTVARTAATDVAEEAILAAHPLLAGCAMWHWCGTPNFTVARTTATDVAEETVLAGHPLLASGACNADALQVNRGRLFPSVVVRLLGLLLELHCWRTPNFTVARTAATDVAEEAILAAHPLLAGCAMWHWCGTPNFTVARTTATDVAEETVLAGHPLLASGACNADALQVNRGRLFHSVVIRLLGLLLELHCWRTPNFTVTRTTATDVAEETILAGHPLLASGACNADALQVNRGRLFPSVVVRLLGLLLELHCWRTPNFTVARTAATDVAEEAILAAHPLLAGCAMWHWCGTPNFTVARTTATDVAEETVLAGHPLLASGACNANTLQVNRGRLFHSVVIRLLGLLLELHCWRTPNFTVTRTTATDVAEETILAGHPLLASGACNTHTLQGNHGRLFHSMVIRLLGCLRGGSSKVGYFASSQG